MGHVTCLCRATEASSRHRSVDESLSTLLALGRRHKVLLCGEVINIGPGSESDPEAHRRGLTTLSLRARGDVTRVVCYQDHLPMDSRDLMERFIAVDARLQEVRVPIRPG